MRDRGEEDALLGSLLPDGVRWAEGTGEPDEPCPYPEEEALMARAVPGRRREFAAARVCAHRALAALGAAPGPLLRGRRGAPAWPARTVGSITHCAGYRAAAVAPAARLLALGIDAEPHAPLPPGVRGAVAFGPEEAWLRTAVAGRPDLAWDRLLFSAKESVYKAWSGYGGAWLGFEDAEVSWWPGTDTAPDGMLGWGPGTDTAPDGIAADRDRDAANPLSSTPDTAPDGRPPHCARARAGRLRAAGRFRARLLVDPPAPPPLGPHPFPRVLDGRWLVREGLLLTAVAVPRPVPPPHRTAPKERLR
ncbi:4'-phosphopantetheinyl transferase superfamily protein [Streptomyces sp. SP18ES09]|uniref:4'-phosphopantetheinyl transferase family protein n=1 Tax=Streptomyces sp. SP18ES09 TaxID=3002532 RepID=UPI002E7751FB|nr:4'-phosphopantetheinyl transferase superfamily protein [Streptomyces sp. SP18ES09]MEE1819528.1 4'-phosphopantetheinyl transferase superfamily protein [Streptomyces sp. SP18ES09]